MIDEQPRFERSTSDVGRAVYGTRRAGNAPVGSRRNPRPDRGYPALFRETRLGTTPGRWVFSRLTAVVAVDLGTRRRATPGVEKRSGWQALVDELRRHGSFLDRCRECA